MKHIVFNLLFFVVLYSCNQERDPHEKVDDLLQLDSIVWDYTSIEQFTSLCVSRKSINRIKVCDSIHEKCSPGELNYTIVLDQINVPVKEFNSITNRLCKIRFKTFYRYGDFSIWVEDGAFGDIYGYLINHNPEVFEVKSFELEKRYHVGVGKKVRENVYYFSSNYE